MHAARQNGVPNNSMRPFEQGSQTNLGYTVTKDGLPLIFYGAVGTVLSGKI